MILGVDVGGTFTDAALLTGDRLVTGKSPTTPADQSEGVMNAVEQALGAAGAHASDVERFVHGMTVGTNALLEGRVARTALLATEGFTDLEELGRQARPELSGPARGPRGGGGGRELSGSARGARRRSRTCGSRCRSEPVPMA